MSSIVLSYIQLSQQYQRQYGPDTVVLYMVGSFYEIYSLVHPITNVISDITPIEKVTSVCNLNIAHKHSILGENVQTDIPIPPFPCHPNPLQLREWVQQCPPCGIVMAGVRDYCGEKYIEKLVEEGFTVVVFDQEKTKEGKKEIIQRKLQSICSPGTYFPNNVTTLTNQTLCIWIEKNRQAIVCGAANVNTFTGETSLFEYQTEHLHMTSFDELERKVCSCSPSEILFVTNLSDQDNHSILSFSGISRLPTVLHSRSINDKSNTIVQNCTKQTYIRALLQLLDPTMNRIPGTNVYDSCEEFHTYPIATQALCYLLDFVQEHNKDLVRKLSFPTFQHTNNRMMLVNRTLRQLHIVPPYGTTSHGHLSSMERFLNQCSTPMGKRLLSYQLLHPTFDTVWLQQQYDQIDRFLQCDISTMVQLRKHLAGIRDIDKCCRQIVTKKLSTGLLYALYESVRLLTHDMIVPWMQSAHVGRSFLAFVEERFHLSLLVSNPNDVCFIRSHDSTELEQLLAEQTCLHSSMIAIQRFFEVWTSVSESSMLKLHETEKGGITFQLTKKRATTLRNKLANCTEHVLDISPDLQVCPSDIRIVSLSSTADELVFPQLQQITQSLLYHKELIKTWTQQTYMNILQEMEESWYDKLRGWSADIAQLDVFLNKAYLAQENKWCAPQLVESPASRVSCRTLRHPLIEQLQTHTIYVPNDVSLDQNGILLTGYNGIGKTSLIRALGIAVLMAQSGFYVPCSSFQLTPFRSIYCNIEKNDNLFQNLSTFQLEMSELRVILKHADEHSLVLGDELLNSTELQSGLSLMVATLITLCQKRTSFVIATHLNQLTHYHEINALTNLRMMHMSVQYDHERQQLVYDRRLQEGFGSISYGLEVARSLYMEPAFLELSFSLRNKYFPEQKGILSQKTSSYSSKKLKGMCERCQKIMGSEIHHVLEQHLADAQGYIEHVYQHHPANLMNVCETCHREFHRKGTI